MSGIINIIIISEKKGLYIQHSDNRNDTEKKTIFPKKEQLSTFPQHTHTHTHGYFTRLETSPWTSITALENTGLLDLPSLSFLDPLEFSVLWYYYLENPLVVYLYWFLHSYIFLLPACFKCDH